MDEKSRKLPASWDDIASLGWLGLAIEERFGGQGFSIEELALVVFELGRDVLPGPFLTSVWASSVVQRFGTEEQRRTYLSDMASGRVIGAVAISSDVVLAGGYADLLLLLNGNDLDIYQSANTEIVTLDGTDLTRPLAKVSIIGPPSGKLKGAAEFARNLGWVLAAAEASGIASACLDMANGYAKERRQFGRLIGSFQAIKHQLANMLIDSELATAAAWDAARAASVGLNEQDANDQLRLTAAIAATEAIPTAVRAAWRNIQVHGGVACTWEHDAHILLRRAAALRAVFSSDVDPAVEATFAARDGIRRNFRIDLPTDSAETRARVSAFRDHILGMPERLRRQELVQSGYLYPHWPPPWGLDAGPVEQLVIDEELADVERPDIGIGAWVTLTIAQNGTSDQVRRFVAPSLLGEISFCQMFSEPDAGSDAAAIRTRGTRVEGGWLVSGQKVWTSDAHLSDRGLATVRTDVDVPKHRGITMMAVDLHSPGVEIRPLRQITGEENFNEVFFDEVFVPDDDVIGEVGGGWRIARATLGNERISIGRITPSIDPYELAVSAVSNRYDHELGRLIARVQSQQSLQLRMIDRAIAGSGPGPEGNITKLLRGEIAQQAADLALRMAGVGAIVDSESIASFDFLHSMMLTIAGGTGEIVRSQIGEIILGLPREPGLS
jgi:alkylation response protein AidB-like acyl-CoA dehydrogenase